jgi:hypothetical protein
LFPIPFSYESQSFVKTGEQNETLTASLLPASTPWVARPLFIVRNDTLLKFEASAFLHAKRGRDCRRAGQDTCFHGTDDSMLRLKSAMRNVSIIGESGATVRMWKQDCAPQCRAMSCITASSMSLSSNRCVT